MKKTLIIQLILSILTGFIITWVDSRTNWDDTGVSVMMILSASLIFGYFSSQKPWLTALAISVWIPLFGIVTTGNFGSLLALLPGFAGAYLGFILKRKG